MPEPPIVEFAAVSKRYRDMQALEDVSFQLREGEVLGYLGPNGAGKTTTLKILAGLLQRFEGEARVLGHALPDKQHDVHHHIGFLPQSVGFQDWRTAHTALRSLGLLSGVPASELDGRIQHWLERFDLAHVRHKRIRQLSGGMIQKLGLIQALLHNPKLVILDEPLSGLDPASRRLVKDVVRECRSDGVTVMFSSHILSDVEDVADRIGILRGGRLLTSGRIDELRAELPTRIDVEFATPPRDVAFLSTHRAVASTQARTGQRWRLELLEGADVDAVVHDILEATRAGDGRIRAIGPLAPDLDALYSQYIEAEEVAR